jgi:hypothetical protein
VDEYRIQVVPAGRGIVIVSDGSLDVLEQSAPPCWLFVAVA